MTTGTTINATGTSQTQGLAALAEAWRLVGATSFGLWQDGRPLHQWPAGAPPVAPSCRAPVQYGSTHYGELRLAGVGGALAQARLEADAQLLAELARLEGDLETMTGELIESQDQLLALYDLARATRRHVTVGHTLQALAQGAARLVKADASFALHSSGDGAGLVLHYPAPRLDDATVWSLFRQVQDSRSELLWHGDELAGALAGTCQSLFVVPIRTRNEITAGLGLLSDAPHCFASPEIKLARAIAEQAGAQIENVLLYQETLDRARLHTEMDLARRIQTQLLPQKPPAVPGLDIFARTRPAREVGGDFYDFLADDERPFLLAIGDVSGKGLSASLLMSMTRTALRSAARSIFSVRPATVMGRANEDLYDDFTEVGMFATAFVGQLQPASRRFLYANAGHSPVIYRPAAGPARLLEADGTAIGILPECLCEDQHVLMEPGALLVAMTDGFSEARNPQGELLGYDALLRLADGLAGRPAPEIAQAFFDAVDTFESGHAQDDDQTILVVRGVRRE